MRARAAVLVSLLAATAATTARAQDETPHHAVSLAWRAPSGCPSAQDLRVAIAHALDWSPFTPGATPELVLTGEAHAAGDRWSIALSLATARGEPIGRRELVSESSSCAEALDSVALVAAMMIESPRIEARLHAAPPPLPFGGLVLAARLGAVVDFLVWPTVSVGARAELSLTPPGAWPILLSATFFPESVTKKDEVEAHLRLLALSLGVCPPLLNTRDASVAACGGIDVLLIEVSGSFLADARTYVDASPRPWAGIRAEARIAGPLRAGASLEIGVPLAQYHYTFLRGADPVPIADIGFVTLAAAAWLALQIP